jgi:hypothetical protein
MNCRDMAVKQVLHKTENFLLVGEIVFRERRHQSDLDGQRLGTERTKEILVGCRIPRA